MMKDEDDDDVESLVGTTKYAGGAGLQKWDKARSHPSSARGN